MAVNSQKLKLLHLMKMLNEKTSATHGLTMSGILKELEARGVKAERKSVYRDIESLREFGFDVKVLQRSPAEYALVSRELEVDDLRIVADALQSSAELTQRKADSIVRRLKGLAPEHDRARLDGRLNVAGRIKMQGDSSFAKIDRINDAIAAKRKVSFRYFHYDAAKQKVMRPGNERYVEAPVEVLCVKGAYYLVTVGDAEGAYSFYRLDHMDYVEVSDEPAERVAFDGDANLKLVERALLGGEGADAIEAELIVESSAMDAVIDRFGLDVDATAQGDGRALVKVPVVAGPAFYGWLSSLCGAARVVSPASLAEGYKAHLRAALNAC